MTEIRPCPQEFLVIISTRLGGLLREPAKAVPAIQTNIAIMLDIVLSLGNNNDAFEVLTDLIVAGSWRIATGGSN